MSEVTRGVIGMPLDLAMASSLSRAQFHARAQALLADFAQLKAENAELKQNVFYSDQIIETRNRLLKSIPACPVHGDECVPHAQEWVEAARKDSERYRWLTTKFLSVTQDPGDGFGAILGLLFVLRGEQWLGVTASIDAAMAKELDQ